MATITPGIDEETAPKRENTRRRNRAIHSCLECRRRKMKCDRTVGESREPQPWQCLTGCVGPLWELSHIGITMHLYQIYRHRR